jgi:hypothetical protein
MNKPPTGATQTVQPCATPMVLPHLAVVADDYKTQKSLPVAYHFWQAQLEKQLT